eukprot:1850374-Amphidinium_carterae.1
MLRHPLRACEWLQLYDLSIEEVPREEPLLLPLRHTVALKPAARGPLPSGALRGSMQRLLAGGIQQPTCRRLSNWTAQVRQAAAESGTHLRHVLVSPCWRSSHGHNIFRTRQKCNKTEFVLDGPFQATCLDC